MSGVVVARQGNRLVPVFRARVAAREAAGADILAVARTDREGRFLIVDLPFPRVALSAHKHGYFTLTVNGREDDSVVLDCSAAEDCTDIEFELRPTAVISGMVVDELGEPMAEVQVRADQDDSQQERRQGRSNGAHTDDRGYFRITGLKPGAYTVKAEGRARSFVRQDRLASDPFAVELEEGDEITGVQITARVAELRRETYKVSGKISGADLSREGSHMIQARELAASNRGGYVTAQVVEKDGSFVFNALQPVRYALGYVYRANRHDYRDSHSLPLGTIEVSGEISGLALTPLPPTGFSGVVRFETGRRPRRQLRMTLVSDDTEHFAWDRLEPPDFRFEFTNLMPGKYKLAISGGGRDGTPLYVKGIRRGDEFSPGQELLAAEAVVDRFDIVLSDEVARVHGRVKAASEPGPERIIRKGAQFQVALSGPKGTRVTQADQYGRFQFDSVIPGEYRVCGWADLERRAVDDDKTWEQAGNAVRKFTVEAGSDIELDLTAAP